MKSVLAVVPVAILLAFIIPFKQDAKVTPVPDLAPSTDTVYVDLSPTVQSYGIVLKDVVPYSQRKQQAQQLRSELRRDYETGTITIDSVGVAFREFLVNKIIPHWYGTDWDFNGYTNTPNEGLIACGYFVSTTMKHIGINVNRYHLAQQAALNGAKTITSHDSILKWYKSVEDLYTLKEGLYKVGLDNHVGYFLRRGNEAFFLHSSYVGTAKVTVEFARKSIALNSSNNYLISPISDNPFLMKKWLYNQEIPVVRAAHLKR